MIRQGDRAQANYRRSETLPNMTPLKLQSYDKGNLVLTLEYRNYSMNCVINDDEFTFTIPDGASVVYA